MTRALAAGVMDFPALLESVDGLFPDDPGPDGKKLAAVRWLLGLWAAKDPDAALAFVRDRKDQGLNQALGDVLARVNPAWALELLVDAIENWEEEARMGDGNFRRSFVESAARRLAAVAPERFLQLPPASLKWFHPAVSSAFANLAKQEPQKAKALWESLQEESGLPKKESLCRLMDSLVQSDSGAAQSWLESMPDPETRQLALHAWLTALARKDPRAALRELGAMTDLGGEKLSEWEIVDADLPVSDADGRKMVFMCLAKLDRGEALAAWREWNAANPGQLSEEAVLGEIIQVSRGQMVRYPDNPSQFLGALRDSAADIPEDTATTALQAAYLKEQLRDRSPEFVLELAKLRVSEDRAADPGETDQVLVMMLNHAAERDPEAVLKVMDQMPLQERGKVADGMLENARLDDIELRNQIFPLVSAEYWKKSVDSYAGYLSESPMKLKEMSPVFAGLSGEAAVQGVTYFSQMWAWADPIPALDWAVTLLPEIQSAAVEGAVQSWVKWDDAAASAWADALPAGPVRDAAASGLAKSLARMDLSGAMAWARNVANPNTATELLRHLGYDYGSKDNSEFLQLLPGTMNQLGLSVEQRDRVAAAIKKGQEPMDHMDPFAVRKPLD